MTDAASLKAATLVEALPYIRRFAGKIVVVKYGGNAIAGTSDHDALSSFAEDIVLMRLVGMRPVVVHGGGPQISELMARLGKEASFVDGLRVTDAETVDIARMVLTGQVNPQLVAAINVHGRFAVGISGVDAGLIRAIARDPELGFVGDVTEINPEVIHGLIADEFIPVIATIGCDVTGQAYNINADTAAGAIAESLGAEKLVYLTDIEGLRNNVDDPASLIRQTTPDALDALVADGTIVGGMVPKVASCVQAVRNGVRRAHILDGRVEHVLLLELFTDAGIGTMVDGDTTWNAHAFEHEVMSSCPFMPVFGPPAIMFERGSGTELWDSNGKRYLDFLAGIAVVSLGHANPVVAAAIADQASTLVHVSNFFANPVTTSAAIAVNELLLEATGHVGQVFFTNSGAESIECAIKLARKHGGRGRHTVVSALGSFHGRTLAALAATGQPTKHEPFQPMPEGFRHVAWGDLDAMRSAVDGSVAAVLIEPIQGEGGVNPATDEYLQGIRALCDETGALMMVDEIQAGFARTGRWFGFEHAGVSPDVVALAKAMGNGMPVGACWARADVARVFEPGDHGSTYSGTALATRAVLATIDEMRRLDAPGLAQRQGRRLSEALEALDAVVAVRGRGLMLGAQLVPGIAAKAVYADLLEQGLIVNAVNDSTIRLVPPITVTDDEVDEAVALIAGVLATHLAAGTS